MRAEEKLKKLYSIKDKLHPLTFMLIVQFVEDQKSVLKKHDRIFVHEIWPAYARYFKKEN